MAICEGSVFAASTPRAARGRILIVDDEVAILRALTQALSASGYAVASASDGVTAAKLLEQGAFDVVLSDVHMPTTSGLQLLRVVREHDLDVPVILMTGAPDVESAVEALEHGAYRYIVKPIQVKQLEDVLARAVSLHRLARSKREALSILGSADKLVGDRAGLEASFERALGSLWMAFQPIVDWQKRRVFGYEALLRSRDGVLASPDAILKAAERLQRLPDVGRAVRTAVAEAMGALGEASVFVNLHTMDLLDPMLFSAAEPLASAGPRVVLEITERASLDEIKDVPSRIAALREMGFRIALDDLGAGYAGLNAFAQLEPDIVKLDRELIRNVDREATKRKVVASVTALCRDLGILVVAEGVERQDERTCLEELGCDLLQGYLFARPSWPPPECSWS